MHCLSSVARIGLSALVCLLTLPISLPAQQAAFPPVSAFPSADGLAPFPIVSVPATLLSPAQQGTSVAYGRLPLSFEPNVGQVNKRAQFLCRGQGYSLFLTPTGAIMAMQRAAASTKSAKRNGHCLPALRETKRMPMSGVALYMTLLGASPQAQGVGESKQDGVVSYFVGKDSSKWHSGISTFGRVRYRNVYPGVDLLYYGNQSQLEYDLIVKPGADYHQAQLKFAGASNVTLDSGGNLQLKLAGGETVWKRPVAYQVNETGKRQWVASWYLLDGKSKTVRFMVGHYDRSKTLVLDPGLVYSTYLGGSRGPEQGRAIAVDRAGNAYIAGFTGSSDFPITPGAYQTVNNAYTVGGKTTAFVTKLNATGTALIYSTFMGGSVYSDTAEGIAIDSAGNAYITGGAGTPDFPTTPGAFQTTNKGWLSSSPGVSNAFVTKLNASGTELIYSTFLGGSGVNNTFGDGGGGIVVDSAGNAYVTGKCYSADFPTTSGAFQTTNKGKGKGSAFVTKLSADGKSLVYSTYLGGSNGAGSTNGDFGVGIGVDNNSSAYVVGRTYSADFPTTSSAFQTTDKSNGKGSAFVTKLSADGKSLVYSTYLGGSNGAGSNKMTLNGSGNVYVSGYTGSTDFPTTPGAFQTTNKGKGSAFVTKLSADGKSLVYSTLLGGSGDIGIGIAVDSAGNAYISGQGGSPDFPTTPNAFQRTSKGNGDAYLTELNATGTALLYSTFLGGSGSDSGERIAILGNGSVYLTGWTYATDFPVTSGAFQKINYSTGSLAFVTHLILPQLRFDANNDGHLDLLWYNQTTGDLTSWLQNGINTIGSASLATKVDTHWHVTGIADLNHDGNADLLWRNQSTGDLSVWYMQGTTLLGSAFLGHGVPLAWQVVTCADLDGDGNPDLIWRNTQTGDLTVWYMQGATNIGSAYLANAVPLVWQVVGSTDFNGNGHMDLLWRNTQTGDISVWDMNNQQLVSSYYLVKGVPLEWQVSAVGDLDSNGVPDILWRNTRTGDVAAWLFSDATHYSGASIASGVPLNWQLVGPR